MYLIALAHFLDAKGIIAAEREQARALAAFATAAAGVVSPF
jgi:hypothetical protein